jgi:ubiquitin-protein ligase
VLFVKQAILAQGGSPPVDLQHLVFSTRQLTDDCSLSSCGIAHECTQHVRVTSSGSGPSGESTATRKAEQQLDQPVQILVAALTASGGSSSSTAAPSATPATAATAAAAPMIARTRESVKRIMREMKKVHADKHPAIDIFPSTEDVGFWRAIIEGPGGTPYRGGTFAVWIKFPSDYPQMPPEIRFVMPIIHCNINSQGRICHSIFDRNWSPDTTICTVMKLVYGLLLCADTSDPLDSDRALAFYDD